MIRLAFAASCLGVLGMLSGVDTARAQGVTGAAVQGLVRTAEGAPVEGATVLATNQSDGERWRTTSSSSGRFMFERLSVGGPYTVEARAIGYAPARVDGLTLSLGRRHPVEVVLRPAAFELQPLEVRAPDASGDRTGPNRTVTRAQLSHLPILNRDVLALVGESPQVTLGVFGPSIAGQSPRHNNYQIDGGENNSLYGQFSATPGGLINLLSPPGGGGLRTVALDAVQEVQILVAPFDVRQGSFTGGLINAVTKSGTNTVHGSAFGSLQNQWLAGQDLGGNPLPHFHTIQFGGTLGGPILRDRLHFFLAADLQASVMPYQAVLIGSDTTGGADSAGVGIRYASALRFQQILSTTYGVDPGSFGAVDTRNPAQSLLGKLTFQTGVNSRIELSQNYVHGEDRGFLLDREPYGAYALSSADGRISSTSTATRVTWNALFGDRLGNELIAAYLRIRDACRPAAAFPSVSVAAEAGVLEAGRRPVCIATTIAQDAIEITDNLSFGIGAHRLVAGTHDELLRFRDPGTIAAGGAWDFSSLDSLASGQPAAFSRAITGALRAEGPVADFRVRQLGLYFQDQWSPGRRLTVTGGVRVDVPLFPDRPVRNPDLEQALGIDTKTFPNGQALWSPRVGLTYAPGAGAATVRGGIGLFSGRPPYYAPADAFRSTGLEQFFVFCQGDDVPDFTIDPARQPSACRTTGAFAVPRITFVDRSFRFPQELKLSAGIDWRLPWAMTGTADVLYSRSLHQADFVDMNLAPTGAVLAGEDGRLMYGSLDSSAVATPSRRTPLFTSVVRQGNSSGNWFASISAGLTKRLGGAGEVSVAYTYSETRDRVNPTGLGISLSGLGLAADQIGSTALEGSLEDRRLSRSVLDVPHKLRLSGTAALPLGARLSVIYEGSSGSPFTYVVDGDINADGFGPEVFGQQSNDPFYVPVVAQPGGDMALLAASGSGPASNAEYAALQRYIDAERCLRARRGHLVRRNTCRNAWRTPVDLRLAKGIRAGGERTVELTLDLFNVLHLIDRDWGLVRRTADFGLEEVPLVRLVGFDTANQRGVYQLRLPDRRHVDFDASRWRGQLGGRYLF